MRFAALAFALALSACAIAHPVEQISVVESPHWRAVDAETGKIRDIEGLEQLARDFPDSGSVRLRLLQPYLAAGEMEKVMETLEWLYDRGYVFSEVSQAQIPKLMEGVDPGRIAERLRAEAEVIAKSEVIATVPAEAGLVESVVRDPQTGHLLATSHSGASIWSIVSDDTQIRRDFADGRQFSGIVRRELDETIWAAAGRFHIPGKDGKPVGGLASLCVSLECSNELIVLNPDAVSMNDLHSSPDGTLFASDSIGGGIYWHKVGTRALEQFVPPGTFRSPQGLTTDSKNTKLYVSDYRYGIAIIDLETREISRLSTELTLILDGVDGMWLHDNELIVVQNGTSPMRISAFQLSDDGRSVVGHRVLEQANDEWTEPLSGNLDGDTLLYIGNGQWDRYVDGVPAHDKPPLPTQIRRLPLD